MLKVLPVERLKDNPMKKKSLIIALIPLLVLSLGGLSSCANDLEYVKPINDNYRNYYEIFVGSYADSNDDGIGDLNGITNKLDYLHHLGYTGIWLTPIHQSPSYHKYNVTDYYSVDKDFGTIEDLKTLVREAHDLNINVILDLVMNHCSTTNQIFKDAVVAYDKQVKGLDMSEEEVNLANSFIFYENEQVKNEANPPRAAKVNFYPYWYRCDFDIDMPDFNLLEPSVMKYFEDIMNFYLSDIDIDGFRMDAVIHFESGNMTANAEIISSVSDYAKSVKESAYIVCEAWTGGYQISEYYQKSTADSYFYFPATNNDDRLLTRSLARKGFNVGDYNRLMVNMYEQAYGHIPAPFINNHDVPRIGYEDEIDKNKILYALLGMLNGTTYSYYGDEIGMTSTTSAGDYADVAYRAHMPWGEDNDCNDPKPSGVVRPGVYPYGSVKENLDDENSITNYYRMVNIYRNKYPAISRGEPSIVIDALPDNATSLIKKEYDGKNLYLALNLSPETTFNIDIGGHNLDLVVKDKILINKKNKVKLDKNGILTIPPYSVIILEEKGA